MTQTFDNADFSLAYYSGNRKTGSIKVVHCVGGRVSVLPLAVEPESALEPALKPMLVGVSEELQVILLDPKSKQPRVQAAFPADAFPAHIYSDPHSDRDWFMNDGDKATGNDTLNCGDQGSSVTVMENAGSAQARFLKTICVGRGHHQAAFSYPSPERPHVPRRAYISSLNDGTISVIGNDPLDAASYLQVITTIDLCEPDKEEGAATGVPNKSFPHGLAYSPLTGKLYNLNNGYGTIAVIDPVSNLIEERIACKGYSNLIASPDPRYLIARGADRKSDPEHVIGKFAVLDVVSKTLVDKLDLRDVYLSKYFFNPEGSKLYFTTASSGSPEQLRHLKTDVLLVLDMTALPKLELIKEVKVGSSSSVAFHSVGRRTRLVFSSDPESGALVVLDGGEDTVLDTIAVTEGVPHSRIWMVAQ